MNINLNSIIKFLVTLLAVSLISLLLTSCGSRKVQQSEVKEETNTQTSETVNNDNQTSTEVYADFTEETDEINATPIDTTKPIVINNVIYKNARLSIIKKKLNNNVKSKEIVTNKDLKEVKQEIKVAKQEEKKQVERKSYNFWFLLWLLVPVAIYIAYRFIKKKLWFVNIISKIF